MFSIIMGGTLRRYLWELGGAEFSPTSSRVAAICRLNLTCFQQHSQNHPSEPLFQLLTSLPGGKGRAHSPSKFKPKTTFSKIPKTTTPSSTWSAPPPKSFSSLKTRSYSATPPPASERTKPIPPRTTHSEALHNPHTRTKPISSSQAPKYCLTPG